MKRTELRRRTPLRARTPLRSGTTLERIAPLRQQSTKRRRSRAAYRAAVAEATERAQGRCEGHEPLAAVGVDVPCRGQIDPHHVRPRGRGGVDEAANLAMVCRSVHDFVHANPQLAAEAGLLAPSWSDR